MLPSETAPSDPLAVLAAQSLHLHQAVVQANTEAVWVGVARDTAAARVQDLTDRVAELSATAFELAGRNMPTTELELLRAQAVADLEQARLDDASLELRLASARNVGDGADAAYVASRKALAGAVARVAGLDASRLETMWATTSAARLDVVLAALSQVGDPYVFGATGPETFDCSGLTGFAWQAAGVTLPHYTVTQRTSTLDVAEAALRPGDLVFNLDGPNGGHVMMFLGLGHAVVEARQPGTTVSVSTWRAVTGFGSPILDDDATGNVGEALQITSNPAA